MAPETYTHGHHASVLRNHRSRTAANSAAYLLPRLHAGLDLLDVGCGPGTITVDLARAVAPGRVVGVDGAAAAIAAARVTSDDAGINVELSVGDAYRLDHADATFDVVHAHQVLQHLADPVAALIEWKRVCRAGGVVAARDADYAAMSWWPADPRLDRWLQLYRTAARANGGEPDAGRRLSSWARAAGLAGIEVSASVWCFAAPQDRELWSQTWAERTTDSTLAAQLRDQGLADEGELADIATAWRAWGSADDGWFAVVHGEILATVPG